MEFVVTLSQVLPVVALASVFFLIIFNICYKIRRLIPVRVNCWFCNTWTTVSYDNKNCFDCPSCLQYNGFNKDGSYNKTISEQFESDVTNSFNVKQIPKRDLSSSNGLCYICNEFQSLKIRQLANFSPKKEKNYDEELKEFTKHLDELYKLCPRCEQVVSDTIQKQNKWLLGLKFLRMRANGLTHFAHNSNINTAEGKAKGAFVLSGLNFLNGLFTYLILIIILANSDYSSEYLNNTVLKHLLPIVTSVKEYLNVLYVSEFSFLSYTSFMNKFDFFNRYVSNLVCSTSTVNNTTQNMSTHTAITISNVVPSQEAIDLTFISMIALILQLVISFFNYEQRNSLLKLLSWAILIFITYIKPTGITSKSFINIIKVITSLFIIYVTTFHKFNTAKRKSDFKTKKHTFIKLKKRTCEDEHCNSMYENGGASFYENNISRNSSSSDRSVQSRKSDFTSSCYLRPFAKSIALKHLSPGLTMNCSPNFDENTYEDVTRKIRQETALFGSGSVGRNVAYGEKPLFMGSQSPLNRSFESTASFATANTNNFFDKNLYNSYRRNSLNDSIYYPPSTMNQSFQSSSSHSPNNHLNSTIVNNYDHDLQLSFSKLHVDQPRNNINLFPQAVRTSPSLYSLDVASRPKPVLTPPKLVNIHKTWNVAPSVSCISRSSSQTSGFVSHNDASDPLLYSSLPPSRNHSPDRTSLFSEPAYHINNFAKRSSPVNGTYSPFY